MSEREFAIWFEDDSLTVQSDRAKTEINNILAAYSDNGGIITHLAQVQASYKDISEFTDLKDAIDQARRAEHEFMRLPSEVRRIFDHNVATWLDTSHDSDKIQTLMDKGLIPKHGDQIPIPLETPAAVPETAPVPAAPETPKIVPTSSS